MGFTGGGGGEEERERERERQRRRECSHLLALPCTYTRKLAQVLCMHACSYCLGVYSELRAT